MFCFNCTHVCYISWLKLITFLSMWSRLSFCLSLMILKFTNLGKWNDKAFGKHSHDRIISIKRVWAKNPANFYGSSCTKFEEWKVMHMSVRGMNDVSVYAIFWLDFGAVLESVIFLLLPSYILTTLMYFSSALIAVFFIFHLRQLTMNDQT